MTRQEQQVVGFPNPFTEKITFSFTLPQGQAVVVKVYDRWGRELALLYQGEVQAHKPYRVEWRPAKGQPAGLYIIRLQTPRQVSQHKILFAR